MGHRRSERLCRRLVWFNVANLVMESINTVCENTNICNVWTEKKNVYRKMGNGIAFAGKQRYVDISCQNSVFTPGSHQQYSIT